MRENFKKLKDVRSSFTGIFVRFGTKSGWQGLVKTILLQTIKDNQGKLITDHLWFNLTKSFEKLDLKEGDIVRFEARVKEYYKGYNGYREDMDKTIELDYKLSHPTKVELINEKETKQRNSTTV